MSSQSRVLELEENLLVSQNASLELEERLLNTQSRVLELEESWLNTQSWSLELQAGLLNSQVRVFELEHIEQKYHLLIASKTLRYTKFMRKLYFEFRFFFSRVTTSYTKLIRISQFLKRFPRIRNKCIWVYFLMKSGQKRVDIFKSRGASQQQYKGSSIEIANQNSMIRSFTLNSEKY